MKRKDMKNLVRCAFLAGIGFFCFSGESKAQLQVDSLGRLIFGEFDDADYNALPQKYDWIIRSDKGLYWTYGDEPEYNRLGRYFTIDVSGKEPSIGTSVGYLSFMDKDRMRFTSLVAHKFLSSSVSETETTASLQGGLTKLSALTPRQGRTLTQGKSASTPVAALNAEELERQIPNAVYTDEDGKKFIDYTQLVPYLVNAVKELEAKVISQQDLINTLQEQSTAVNRSALASSERTAQGGATLYQNTPNPATGQTRITCYLPESVKNAYLLICDVHGVKVQQVALTYRGNQNHTLSVGGWNKGIYFYSLVADGQLVDTKKLEVK